MNGAILAGLFFGFLGSLHCVGMCGPLLLALPLENKNKTLGLGFYHLGRIVCYGILGALLSVLGVSLRYSGLQEFLSISVGVLMLIGLALFYLNITLFKNSIGKTWVLTLMKTYWKKFFEKKSIYFLGVIGFLNGLLPCGFVYIALSFSLLFIEPINSFTYMIFFGIGTVPALIGVSFFSKFISTKWRQKVQILVPIGTVIVSILLILRGLSLDIPYISPVLKGIGCAACH
jgi:sulfite exporter TauE/SafE